MKSRFTKPIRVAAIAAASLACVGAIALAATEGVGPTKGEIAAPIPATPYTGEETLAELAFPDAPYGVDPVVTGPKSVALTARQDALGCAEAVWPKMPVDCYPN
ncbi:MAG TPA: hypothetical protein VMF90_03185 [Rhizobiaceae bacterium]|nr:hypothetical protein [Rhizobiaceae bacterium]